MSTATATESTKVIFRKFREGDVIALFPETPWNSWDYHTCSSYQHIGQHGPASVHLTGRHTLPVSDEEAAPLRAELERIGYRLEVCKRRTRGMDRKRLESLR